MKVTFDKMCREEFECPNYIEWEETLEISDYGRDYESTILCVSCTEVGQSYNIEEYPECCPHKKALDKYTKKAVAAYNRWVKQTEQDEIWKKLNAVNT